MPALDVATNPPWQRAALGNPIPDSAHAVSVALPLWEHVVGYEEKDPKVVGRLHTGYPRFLIHPAVQELASRHSRGRPCLPFPSARAAAQCAGYVRKASGAPAQVVSDGSVHVVITEAPGETPLRAFWQHTGLIVSSRQAEAHLAGRRSLPEDAEIRRSLRRQLAAFYDAEEADVFLTPTGMAAQFAALQAVLRRRPGRPTAQLGFPYVDTLKLQQKLGAGGHLLHHLGQIRRDLEHLLEREELAACFGEIPGNPLLGSADLREIAPLLRRHRVPLVADDVVATPLNVDLSGHADLIATSLTKFIAGTGDVMGGALICHPRSPLHDELRPLLQADHEELLWSEDALLLERQARSFPDRISRHNASGLLIAERLRAHPGVERVWYPKWEFNEAYEAVRRPDGGYGALVTFLPRDAERTSPAIYDRLPFCKGPSLGTVFTLACPFTLLAHYTELEWAESCGVSRNLIRLSVGLEDPEDLWQRLKSALESV